MDFTNLKNRRKLKVNRMFPRTIFGNYNSIKLTSSYSMSYIWEEAKKEYKVLSKMARNAPRTPYVKSFLTTCPNYCLENESDIRAFKA